MSEREDYKRRFYCKLTCEGGSERGLCSCVSPAGCEMPKAERDAAGRRMVRQVQRDIAFDDAMRILRGDT